MGKFERWKEQENREKCKKRLQRGKMTTSWRTALN